MSKIFICYRREDSRWPAQWIYKDLTDHFGANSVVFDVDTIPLGRDFRKYLNEQVSECDILLAVIGDQWLELLRQRLDDPKDFVRIEIQAALERDIPVVPVLVGKASVPSEGDLPPALAGLAYRQATEVGADADLPTHLKRLIGGLERLLAEQEAALKAEDVARQRAEEEVKRKAEGKEHRRAEAEAKRKAEQERLRAEAEAKQEAGRLEQERMRTDLERKRELEEERKRKEEERQRAEAKRKTPGTVFQDTLKDGSKGPKLVVIPAGEFQMGDIQGSNRIDHSEQPVHEVHIANPFAMGKYAVTFEDYDRYAKATGRELPDDEGWGQENRPVIYVSWEDAVAYTEWLSDQTGKDYRLPTEAEWEYAARARTKTDYWWGNEMKPNMANCEKSDSQWGGTQTAPVGSFPANPFGLHDTVGNVWEWVQDCWHGSYKGAPEDGKAWDEKECARRVVRGGSWSGIPRDVRSASRGWSAPGARDFYVGFRLAQDL